MNKLNNLNRVILFAGIVALGSTVSSISSAEMRAQPSFSQLKLQVEDLSKQLQFLKMQIYEQQPLDYAIGFESKNAVSPKPSSTRRGRNRAHSRRVL